MPDVAVTRRARRDLAEIALFTERRWGRRQRNLYLGAIVRRLYRVAERPDRDRSHPDIPEGCRIVSVGRHFAVYRRTQTGLLLIRVLHQSMDITAARLDPVEKDFS